MADAKVAILNVVPVDRTGAPQKNVIEFIERMLRRAKSGEMQSVALGYVNADGRPCEGFCHGERGPDAFILPTALQCVAHTLIAQLNATDVVEVDPPEEPA